MERRINRKIFDYTNDLKSNIREEIKKSEFDNTIKNSLIKYILDYEQLILSQEDFVKRKRVKNVVPLCDRCTAKRASGEQCTRRKKDDDDYCGTHSKGRPHGIINSDINQIKTEKIALWAEEIQGIMYYIDKNGNVYKTEDIINNVTNPKVIASYTKVDGHYKIQTLNT